jgi:two-component system cell cycle sensor histidine kinase/response regulator CckA
MEQVIMNLVVNARDIMLNGGTLTIETANAVLDRAYLRAHGVEGASGDYVMLAVTDTGPGMDESVKGRIFEPFFTTKERAAGTGLGLSTVYGIIKQNKGYIWPYSEPGKGTTMKVYLPRSEDISTTAPEKGKAAEDVGGGEVVLVVEDDASLRELAFRSLERAGYEVLAAADGEEALRVMEGFRGAIHLLLTDVVMPGMGGQELAEQVRTLRPKIKVLYMSGFPDSALPHDVLKSKANFLQKPFTHQALCRKVRETLEMNNEY